MATETMATEATEAGATESSPTEPGVAEAPSKGPKTVAAQAKSTVEHV
jgi:hypothetical protein